MLMTKVMSHRRRDPLCLTPSIRIQNPKHHSDIMQSKVLLTAIRSSVKSSLKQQQQTITPTMIPVSINPSSSNRRDDTDAYSYEGNIQLLEARFLELTSSIRALYKSNQELQDALDDCPNDPDFIQAINENIGIIKKQQKELVKVVQGMRNLGANVDVPDDIQVMDVDGSVTNPSFQQQQQRSLKSMYTEEKPYKPGPITQCTTTNDNWIYPIDDKYPERSYQLQMSHSAIMQNTLVSLPTGLGKTLIAAVVMYNYYRWFPTGKIVFCAPTRPLVSQQILACYKIMGIPEQHTAEISGRSKPDSRTVMWRNKRVFFCTPQTLVKDIQDDRCDASSIVCVVMDEAHRATGEHANSVLVRLIDDSAAKYRLVGLSATPGADIKSIQAILDTLHISRIEARTEDDPNVSKYVHQTEEEVIVVKQPDVVKALDTKFSELIVPILTRLREEKVSQRLHYDSATLKPWSVIQAQKEYVSRTGDHRLDGQFNILRELVNSRAILKEHGVQMARQKLAEASHKQYMNYITRTAPFQSLMRDMMIVASGASQEEVEATTDTFENNPKLSKLVEVLTEHFERKRAINESTRVIVFSQWRESVNGIVKMLEFQNSTLIKPAQFIGQASKKAAGTKSKTKKKNGSSSTSNNYSTGQDAAGMNQAQQQRVLQQFGEGVYNVLVCTCVAEEGLDVSVMVY